MCHPVLESNASTHSGIVADRAAEKSELVDDKNVKWLVDTSGWYKLSDFSCDSKRTWAEVPLHLLNANQGGLLGHHGNVPNADEPAITLTDEEAALPECLWDELGKHSTCPLLGSNPPNTPKEAAPHADEVVTMLPLSTGESVGLYDAHTQASESAAPKSLVLAGASAGTSLTTEQEERDAKFERIMAATFARYDASLPEEPMCPGNLHSRDPDVQPENRLFATLDPTLRRVQMPSGTAMVLSDTVGFIEDLPVGLVEAFRATLEEVVHADVLLHVLDASAPNAEDQRQSVLQVLAALGLDTHHLQRTMIEVWNKADLVPEWEPPCIASNDNWRVPRLSTSAATGSGMNILLNTIDEVLRRQAKTSESTRNPIRVWMNADDASS